MQPIIQKSRSKYDFVSKQALINIIGNDRTNSKIINIINETGNGHPNIDGKIIPYEIIRDAFIGEDIFNSDEE